MGDAYDAARGHNDCAFGIVSLCLCIGIPDPVNGLAMRSCQRQRAPVPRQKEHAISGPSGLIRELRRHSRGLVAQPNHVRVRHHRREIIPLPLRRNITQDRRMKYDDGRPGRGLRDHGGQILAQVPACHGGRGVPRHRDHRAQPRQTVPMLRPDEVLEPGDVLLIGDVERIEVETGAPDDLRMFRRQRRRCGHFARKHRRVQPGRTGGGQRLPAPVVPVVIGEKAQTRRSADVDKREWPANLRERREKGRASPRLVGLRGAPQHHMANRIAMLCEDPVELRGRVRSACDQAHRGEEEIGLPAFGGKPGKEVDGRGTACT